MYKVFHILLFISLSINNALAQVKSISPTLKKAVFAGGCFWCMEPPFEAYYKKGVIKVLSGYSGGKKANPTYEEVSAGDTGHIEVIEVTYDSDLISYETLLNIFWTNVDPLDSRGQFCDKGEQYLSAVFYAEVSEKAAIDKSLEQKAILLKNKGKVVTKVLPAKTFYPAEEYHQDYLRKNPGGYTCHWMRD